MGSGPRLASPNFILGGGLFLGGGGYPCVGRVCGDSGVVFGSRVVPFLDGDLSFEKNRYALILKNRKLRS